jgi:taurine dioxygenase
MPLDELKYQLLSEIGLGAEITSVDAASASHQEIKTLIEVLAEHGVIVLRDQHLTPAQYVAFAKHFGEIEPSTRERYWLPEQNEIYVISNIVENGREIGNPNDGFVWHTDQYYFERPTAYTFLYGLETPPEGADTQFCSTRRQYEGLSPEESKRFNDIKIIASHSKLNDLRLKEGKPVPPEEMHKVPDVIHPLVRTHPISGKKFLYFSADRASKPIDMSEEELSTLLKRLKAEATHPENVYSHKWRPNDIVIWDNRGLMHTATGYKKDVYRRLAYRLSVIGERPY